MTTPTIGPNLLRENTIIFITILCQLRLIDVTETYRFPTIKITFLVDLDRLRYAVSKILIQVYFIGI